MSKLYIANTSRQKRIIQFRVPEKKDPVRIEIAPGHQALVFDGPTDVIEFIIEQYSIYGIKRASDVRRDKRFVGIAYQIDKPITVENFMIADEINQEALTELGRQTRGDVAKYAEASILNTLGQAGEKASNLSIEIKDLSKDNPQFHEIYSSEPPRDMAAEPAKPRRGRARK